jgi:trypsin
VALLLAFFFFVGTLAFLMSTHIDLNVGNKNASLGSDIDVHATNLTTKDSKGVATETYDIVEDAQEGKISKRIVGGSRVRKGRYPYFVRINVGGYFVCGGTVIADDIILTAKHCDVDVSSVKEITAHVGAMSLTDIALQFKVVKKITHPGYNNGLVDRFDFMIIQIEGKIPDYVPRVILDDGKNVYESLSIVGLGRIREGGPLSTELLEANVRLIPQKDCVEKYRRTGLNVYDEMICASAPGKDTCQGDSGGPLLSLSEERDILVGVTSWGIGCASEFPGVYGKVASVKAWVENNICEESKFPTPRCNEHCVERPEDSFVLNLKTGKKRTCHWLNKGKHAQKKVQKWCRKKAKDACPRTCGTCT